MTPFTASKLPPTAEEIAAAKSAEYWRQQALHLRRQVTASRKRHRKATERSRVANRSAK